MDVLIKLLLSPAIQLTLLVISLCCAVFFNWRYRRGLAAVTLGVLLLLTNKPLADWLAGRYEQQYPALQTTPPAHILVLGCNHAEASFLPLSSQPEPCSLHRLIEAAQLWHRNKDAIIHLSGTIPTRKVPHTEVSQTFLHGLGVPNSHIRLHNGAYNTQQEIAQYAKALHQQPAALVTSAMHMPRAMVWAAHYQLQVLAAPSHFLTRHETPPAEISFWLPRLSALETYHYLFYEYIGLLQSQHWPDSSQPDNNT